MWFQFRYSAIIVGFLVTGWSSFQDPPVQTFREFMAGQPVIDVHVHLTKGFEGNEFYNTKDLKEGKELDRVRFRWMQKEFLNNNVVLALAGGTRKYAIAYAEVDDRIWGGISFPCSKLVDKEQPCEKEFLNYEELKGLYETHGLRSLGESLYNYYGIPATDPRLDPYWRLASELQLPVGIHSDTGPKKVDPQERPNFEPEYANPEELRPILEKYPGLKINLMHFGNEYSEEAIALMRDYPQIYCDISAISILLPKAVWEPNLRNLYAAGLGDRLMFGSDYFGTTRQHLEVIFNIGWLDEEQKRDILYNNAARFLGLSDKEIGMHHSWVAPWPESN